MCYAGAMWTALLVLSLLTLSCATTPRRGDGRELQRDGVAVDEQTWSHDETEIRKRAAFEFSCADTQIRTTILKSFAEWRTESTFAARASEVGVEACGKKAVYVLQSGNWLMNTVSVKGE